MGIEVAAPNAPYQRQLAGSYYSVYSNDEFHSASTTSIIMALITTAVGAGMVEFPSKLAQAGWVGGLFFAVLLNGILALLCGYAMTQCCHL